MRVSFGLLTISCRSLFQCDRALLTAHLQLCKITICAEDCTPERQGALASVSPWTLHWPQNSRWHHRLRFQPPFRYSSFLLVFILPQLTSLIPYCLLLLVLLFQSWYFVCNIHPPLKLVFMENVTWA